MRGVGAVSAAEPGQQRVLLDSTWMRQRMRASGSSLTPARPAQFAEVRPMPARCGLLAHAVPLRATQSGCRC